MLGKPRILSIPNPNSIKQKHSLKILHITQPRHICVTQNTQQSYPIEKYENYDWLRPEFFIMGFTGFFFRFRVGGGGRKNKQKPSENDQLTFFFIISRTISKTSKVNQQSVLNL